MKERNKRIGENHILEVIQIEFFPNNKPFLLEIRLIEETPCIPGALGEMPCSPFASINVSVMLSGLSLDGGKHVSTFGFINCRV